MFPNILNQISNYTFYFRYQMSFLHFIPQQLFFLGIINKLIHICAKIGTVVSLQYLHRRLKQFITVFRMIINLYTHYSNSIRCYSFPEIYSSSYFYSRTCFILVLCMPALSYSCCSWKATVLQCERGNDSECGSLSGAEAGHEA